jgi:hypothetical protein
MLEKTPRFGFEILLASLLVMMVVPGLIPSPHSSLLLTLLSWSTILASLYLAARNRQTMVIGTIMALLILATNWPSLVISDLTRIVINSSLSAVFLTYVCAHVFGFILTARSPSGQLIYAALCMYLLMGLVWSFIYVLVVAIDPNAIKLALVLDWDDNARHVFSEMYYFSFVTLTTLGYGDILPISRIARSLATLEAVVGQLYLAVVIASLVGLQISERANRK